MSAFLVTPVTMDFAVAGIRHLIDTDPSFAEQANVFNRMSNTQIGEMLLEMNCKAIQQRYPGDTDMLWHKPEDYVWTERKHYQADPRRARNGGPPSGILPVGNDVFKRAISCLHYQCSEDDVPETELYKLLALAYEAFDVLVPDGNERNDIPWDHHEAVPA